jgi:hypothetical protein
LSRPDPGPFARFFNSKGLVVRVVAWSGPAAGDRANIRFQEGDRSIEVLKLPTSPDFDSDSPPVPAKIRWRWRSCVCSANIISDAWAAPWGCTGCVPTSRHRLSTGSAAVFLQAASSWFSQLFPSIALLWMKADLSPRPNCLGLSGSKYS